MGKRKANAKYEHNHTYNPRARESDDRKIVSLKKLEQKRLQSAVEKARETMQSYIPPNERKKYKMDPRYELKGAARVAQEFYRPPDYREDTEPIDLFAVHKGKVWDHEEGEKLLCALMELGVAYHNTMNKGKEAIKTFQEMMDLDKEDHLLARHRLLRCYLDRGEALLARTLMDKHPNDTYSCFAYNRMLIEFIALSLGESDASEKVRDEALKKAIECNPHTVWVIAYHEIFSDCVKYIDRLQAQLPASIEAGSIEDAFMFLDVDLPLWQETEGLVEYVRDFLESNNYAPPLMPVVEREEVEEENEVEKEVEEEGDEEGSESEDENEGEQGSGDDDEQDEGEEGSGDEEEEEEEEEEEGIEDLSPEEMHTMFVDMFQTALEMIEEQQQQEQQE